MGFNIMGLAFSKQFSPQELAEKLQLGKIEKVSDSMFEEATSYNIGDEELYITLVGNGMLITTGSEVGIHGIPLDEIDGNKALLFVVGETSDTFAFDYYHNGKLRSLVTSQGQTHNDEGDKLPIEDSTQDMTERIFGLIHEVTGQKFYSIEPDAKSVCYKVG